MVISSHFHFQVLIGWFGSSILIFVVFVPIWTSWLWLYPIMMFWFVLTPKSLIAAISQSSVSLSQQRLSNSTPGAQGMALYVREGFRSFRPRKLECSCHESCVFRICNRIYNFYVYASYCHPGHNVHFMIPSLTLWLGCNQLMIRQPLSLLVLRMLITMSGWSQSLLLIDMGVMLLIFAICPVVSRWCAVPLSLLAMDSILG